MRGKVVWFVLGVLVGSLFLVSAYPTGGNVQYVTPVVQRIPRKDYTTLLLYTPNGLPLDVKEVQKAVQEFVLKSSPNAKWHAYAVPDIPPSFALYGYGITVAKDGRVSVYIIASRKGHPLTSLMLREKLSRWAVKRPTFGENIPLGEGAGLPPGWEAKSVDSNGNVRAYTEESSPYWHNFGPVEIEVNDPPYGNIYVKFYMYGLWNDNDPNREYFLVAPDKSGEGRYETDPGYGLREVGENENYEYYVTKSAKIIHNWNLEHNLDPKLGKTDPVESLGGHSTIQVTIGYPPAVTFTVTIPDSKMLPAIDRYTKKATWLLKFNTDSDDAKYSFKTNVASEGSVSQNVLHNGQWHAIVNVKFQAMFQYYSDWNPHKTWGGVTWYVKVG